MKEWSDVGQGMGKMDERLYIGWKDMIMRINYVKGGRKERD